MPNFQLSDLTAAVVADNGKPVLKVGSAKNGLVWLSVEDNKTSVKLSIGAAKKLIEGLQIMVKHSESSALHTCNNCGAKGNDLHKQERAVYDYHLCSKCLHPPPGRKMSKEEARSFVFHKYAETMRLLAQGEPRHVCDECGKDGPVKDKQERVSFSVCDKCRGGNCGKTPHKGMPSPTDNGQKFIEPCVGPLGTATREDAYFFQRDQELIKKARPEQNQPNSYYGQCHRCLSHLTFDQVTGSMCPHCSAMVKP